MRTSLTTGFFALVVLPLFAFVPALHVEAASFVTCSEIECRRFYECLPHCTTCMAGPGIEAGECDGGLEVE